MLPIALRLDQLPDRVHEHLNRSASSWFLQDLRKGARCYLE